MHGDTNQDRDGVLSRQNLLHLIENTLDKTNISSILNYTIKTDILEELYRWIISDRNK